MMGLIFEHCLIAVLVDFKDKEQWMHKIFSLYYFPLDVEPT